MLLCRKHAREPRLVAILADRGLTLNASVELAFDALVATDFNKLLRQHHCRKLGDDALMELVERSSMMGMELMDIT